VLCTKPLEILKAEAVDIVPEMIMEANLESPRSPI